MEETPRYIEVQLTVPLYRTFTYEVGEKFDQPLTPGIRVAVPFGKQKIYTGLIVEVHQRKPDYEVKEIIEIIDNLPIVTENQLKLWKWISEYYMCTPGEVMKAALPSGLKLESETKVILNPAFNQFNNLNDTETLIFDYLERESQSTINDLQKLVNRKSILQIIHRMADKRAIILEETLKDKFIPKKLIHVDLYDEYKNETSLNSLLDQKNKAPQQQKIIVTWLTLSDYFRGNPQPVEKTLLLKKAESNGQVLKALIDQNILKLLETEGSRLERSDRTAQKLHPLVPVQQEALQEVKKGLGEKKPVLLHGVTSSGKTEIYCHLIADTLNKGKKVLYLLPEIALTTQIITKLTYHFGSTVGVYHSRYSDHERVEIWNNLMANNSQSYQIILGVRSSVFLPMQDVGLIIVDEEHENTFKQYDPAPRYQARDTAIYLSRHWNCDILLGSATPSAESYLNALQQRYYLVELFHRFKNIKLPEIKVIDTIREGKRKRMHTHFSEDILQELNQNTEKNEQSILFQNRRGYIPYIECKSCGWVPTCTQCDVSMTYHKARNRMVCHYCGLTDHVSHSCPECGSNQLRTSGFGTEKIEDELQILLPEAKIARMDMDSTRTRKSISKIIGEFEEGKTSILIGTQMLSKGLNFENVSFVGILNADTLLNFPDFRAHERSFQLMEQVSGRAGRKSKQGRVIIQTTDPGNYVIQYVVKHDYKNFMNRLLGERKQFYYPPFYRLIKVVIRHKDKFQLDHHAEAFIRILRSFLGNRVIGPEYPPVGRIQLFYIKHAMIKLNKSADLHAIKKKLLEMHVDYMSNQAPASLYIYFDVDPY